MKMEKKIIFLKKPCSASKRSRRPLRHLERSRLSSSKSSPGTGPHRGFLASLCLLLRGGCSVFFFAVFLCRVCVLPGLSTPGSLPRLRIILLTTTVCCTAIQELAKSKALPTGVCVHDFLQLFFSLFLLSSTTLNFIESAQKQKFLLCFRSCFSSAR
jgi:hypothetical protein